MLRWFFFNSVDFWQKNLTFKVRFWFFSMNFNSSAEFLIKFSFERMDSWAKILLFRTHHHWNSTTELILMPSCPVTQPPNFFLWFSSLKLQKCVSEKSYALWPFLYAAINCLVLFLLAVNTRRKMVNWKLNFIVFCFFK